MSGKKVQRPKGEVGERAVQAACEIRAQSVTFTRAAGDWGSKTSIYRGNQSGTAYAIASKRLGLMLLEARPKSEVVVTLGRACFLAGRFARQGNSWNFALCQRGVHFTNKTEGDPKPIITCQAGFSRNRPGVFLLCNETAVFVAQRSTFWGSAGGDLAGPQLTQLSKT